jgi:hypothetical protein
MNKSIKILSLLFALISFIACDNSDDDVVTQSELVVKYTYIKDSSPGKVTFINTTENGDSYMWDFGDNSTSTIQNPVKTYTQTGEYNVKLTAKNSTTGVTSSYTSKVSIFIFAGGLVSNGNYESGTTPWTLGTNNPINSSLLVTQNGNTYFSINVAAAGNPYDVNLSQKGINMIQGKTYRLTFDAWSNVNRSIVVGIGLSADPWTNQTVTRNLTPTLQNFSIDLIANFTSTNSRVIFDMGAAVGKVNIDNVTLNLVP